MYAGAQKREKKVELSLARSAKVPTNLENHRDSGVLGAKNLQRKRGPGKQKGPCHAPESVKGAFGAVR
jgi:hypothetical protein